MHIGMPKTGTSSIQDTFAALPEDDPLYLIDAPANHSGVASLLFEQTDAQDRKLVARGRSIAQVHGDRERYAAHLREQLARSDATAAIFSAERLASIDEASVRRVRDFFAPLVSSIEVIGYVRPAASYMASAFQQNVKAGAGDFEFDRIWPSYQARFEKYDRVFGRENVTLRPFVRSRLHGGDAVLDFARLVGAEILPDRIVRSNDGLSLDAVAILFAHRRLGAGFGDFTAGERALNRELIETFVRMDGPSFRFSRELMAEQIEKNREDVDWIEKRMDIDAAALPWADGPDSIGSAEDLLKAAVAAAPRLEMLSGGLSGGVDTPLKVAEAVDSHLGETILGTLTDAIREAVIAPDGVPLTRRDAMLVARRSVLRLARDGLVLRRARPAPPRPAERRWESLRRALRRILGDAAGRGGDTDCGGADDIATQREITSLAKAVWLASRDVSGQSVPRDPEARRAAWGEASHAMRTAARKVRRILKGRNLEIGTADR